MKTVSILIISTFLFSFGAGVLAQEIELPDSGLTPDSPFYFLEIIIEGIGTFFTFGDLKKAERYSILANERIAEVKDMEEKGKLKSVEKALERYEKQLNKSIDMAEEAMLKGQSFEKVMGFMINAGEATSVHLEVLARVYEKVPEQAKTGIENAIKASSKRHEKVVKALKSSNTSNKVPEQVPVSTNIPQEVRERIQRKAQEELIIEKALQGSELPRELCTKAGGPSEMCDKIPVKGFKSFEELKTFFIGAGAPLDAWELVESRCKEFGATTPNKCFRLLMISSVGVYRPQIYRSTEPTVMPASSLQGE